MILRTAVSREIAAPPERVWDVATDLERLPSLFRGFGPIPGMARVEAHGEHRAGGQRTIHNEDGSAITEDVLALDRPTRHRYRFASELEPPFGRLVAGGGGDWQFEPTAAGTRVTWHFEFELRSALVWPLAWPIVRIFFAGAQARCLAEVERQALADA